MSASATAVSFPALTRQDTLARAPATRHDATWRLDKGQAMSLRAARDSVFHVREGQVWVTRDATEHQASEDLVLAAGASLRVQRGERIVLEPWGHAGAVCSWV